MNQYIIAYGNPAEGFTYVGPFATFSEASEYTEDERGDSWWIIELNAPANLDNE